ncbi:hypothetical protein GCM10027517_05120 [Phycicoccus ginsengisoli]
MFVPSKRQQKVVRLTVWAAVLGLLLGVLAQVVFAVGADAHTALKTVSPEDGARLTTAPTQVVLTFDDPISESFATVTVTGPDGSVGSGRPRVDGAVVTQPLQDGLADGTYTVAFRVVSADGHPVSDRTTFVLASAPAAAGTTSPPQSPASSAPSPTATAAPAGTASAKGDDGRTTRIGLAVGVAALALAAGIALVAVTRRRRSG